MERDFSFQCIKTALDGSSADQASQLKVMRELALKLLQMTAQFAPDSIEPQIPVQITNETSQVQPLSKSSFTGEQAIFDLSQTRTRQINISFKGSESSVDSLSVSSNSLSNKNSTIQEGRRMTANFGDQNHRLNEDVIYRSPSKQDKSFLGLGDNQIFSQFRYNEGLLSSLQDGEETKTPVLVNQRQRVISFEQIQSETSSPGYKEQMTFNMHQLDEPPISINSVQELFDLLKKEPRLQVNQKSYKVTFTVPDAVVHATQTSPALLSQVNTSSNESEETKLLNLPNPPQRMDMTKTFSDIVRNEQHKLEDDQKFMKKSRTLKQPFQKSKFGDNHNPDTSSNPTSSDPNQNQSLLSSEGNVRKMTHSEPKFDCDQTDSLQSNHRLHNTQIAQEEAKEVSPLSMYSPKSYADTDTLEGFCASLRQHKQMTPGHHMSSVSNISVIDFKKNSNDGSELMLVDQFYNSPRNSKGSKEGKELKEFCEDREEVKLPQPESLPNENADNFYEHLQSQVAAELELNQVKKVRIKKRNKAIVKEDSTPKISVQLAVQEVSQVSQEKESQQSPSTDCISNQPTPTSKPSFQRIENLTLDVIQEEEREHSVINFNEHQEDSAFDSSLMDNTCMSQAKMLPHLHRDESQRRSPTNSQDPMINFIYQVATSLKLDPKDIIQLQQKHHITISDVEESKDDFTTITNKVQKVSDQDYELVELQNLYRQYQRTLSSNVTIERKINHRVPKSGEKSLSQCERPQPLEQIRRKNFSQQKFKTLDLSPELKQAEDSIPEVLRLRVQMNIMSLALRNSLEKMKQMEVDLKEHMNQQTDQINKHEMRVKKHEAQVQQHEKKVKLFMVNLIKQNKQLHFAFLFACPLVLSCGQMDQEKYKLIPMLEYEKEYSKIKQRLEASQCQITITKRQCTLDTFRQVLMRRPIGIHFSGHGILNTFETVGDYHEVTKDQGDFLLFETDEGDSQLVSRTQLKNLIDTTGAHLDFVFVASCHSEFVGRIFLEAGSQHVICIDQKHEVDDNAVVTFTNAFYDAIFSNACNICKAFLNAQVVVSISHNQAQASIFKLLVRDAFIKENKKPQRKNSNFSSTVRKNCKLSPREFVDQDTRSNLTFGAEGSSSDNSKSSTPSHSLFKSKTETQKSGVIFPEQQHKKHICRYFGKFPKGTYKEVNQNEPTFQIGSIDQPIFIGRQKDMFKLISKVLSPKSSRLITLLGLPGIGKSSLARKTLQHINERALLHGGYIVLNVRGVKDCEQFMRTFNNEVVTKDSQMSLDIFGFTQEPGQTHYDSFAITNLILEKISSIQRKTLVVIDNAEDLINQDKHNFKMMVQYFLTQVPTLSILLTTRCRLKLQGEINEEIMLIYGLPTSHSVSLFQTLSSKVIPQKEINELLRCKPDFQKYPSEKNFAPAKKLQDHHLFRMLGGNPSMIHVLAPMLADTERNMDLVTLYTTLCADQLQAEDEDPMISIMRSSVHISLQSLKIASEPECLELVFLLALLPGGILPRDLDIIWKAFKESSKTQTQQSRAGSLRESFISGIEGEEYEFSHDCKWKRAFLKLRKHRLIQEKRISLDTARHSNSWMKDTLLSLPMFVRSFAEAQISPLLYEQFTSVLSFYFKQEFARLYDRNQNQIYVTSDSKLLTTQVTLKMNELENNFRAFISRQVEVYSALSPEVNQEGTILESDESELDSEKNSDEEVRMKPTGGEALIRSYSQPDSPDKSTNSTNTFGEKLQIQIKEKCDNRKRLMARNTIPIQDEYRLDLTKLTPKERAKVRWQKALKLVKQKLKKSKLTRVKLLGAKELEETSDSEFENESHNSSSPSTFGQKEGSPLRRELSEEIKNQSSLISHRPLHFEKTTTLSHQARRKTLFRRADTAFSSHRRSQEIQKIEKFKMSVVSPNKMLTMNKMKSAVPSNFKRRTSMQGDMLGQMSDDEIAIIYYVANLILLEQYSMVDSLIEKQLLGLKKCTNTFNGNVRRLYGLCKLQLLRLRHKQMRFDRDQEALMEELDTKIAKIKHCYQRAEYFYTKDVKNQWGLGLTYYQHAELLCFVEQVNSQIPQLTKTQTVIQNQSVGSSSVSNNSHRAVPLKKMLLTFNSERNMKTKPLDQRKNIEEALRKLAKAKVAFEEIHHHRGLALTALLQGELSAQPSSLHDQYSTSFKLISSDGSSSHGKNDSKAKYQSHMRDFREQQRLLHFGDIRQEICISRLQGESISLNVEIVRGIPCSKGIFFITNFKASLNSDISESSDDNSFRDRSDIRITPDKASDHLVEETFVESQKKAMFTDPQVSFMPETPVFAEITSSIKRKPKQLSQRRLFYDPIPITNLAQFNDEDSALKLRLQPISSESADNYDISDEAFTPDDPEMYLQTDQTVRTHSNQHEGTQSPRVKLTEQNLKKSIISTKSFIKATHQLKFDN